VTSIDAGTAGNSSSRFRPSGLDDNVAGE
jgi:hypothetical protein